MPGDRTEGMTQDSYNIQYYLGNNNLGIRIVNITRLKVLHIHYPCYLYIYQKPKYSRICYFDNIIIWLFECLKY